MLLNIVILLNNNNEDNWKTLANDACLCPGGDEPSGFIMTLLYPVDSKNQWNNPSLRKSHKSEPGIELCTIWLVL